jgi:hypothetical protein
LIAKTALLPLSIIDASTRLYNLKKFITLLVQCMKVLHIWHVIFRYKKPQRGGEEREFCRPRIRIRSKRIRYVSFTRGPISGVKGPRWCGVVLWAELKLLFTSAPLNRNLNVSQFTVRDGSWSGSAWTGKKATWPVPFLAVNRSWTWSAAPEARNYELHGWVNCQFLSHIFLSIADK